MSQILNSMQEGDGFLAKTPGKSLFYFQTDWLSNGLAGQFWQMERALRWTPLGLALTVRVLERCLF